MRVLQLYEYAKQGQMRGRMVGLWVGGRWWWWTSRLEDARHKAATNAAMISTSSVTSGRCSDVRTQRALQRKAEGSKNKSAHDDESITWSTPAEKSRSLHRKKHRASDGTARRCRCTVGALGLLKELPAAAELQPSHPAQASIQLGTPPPWPFLAQFLRLRRLGPPVWPFQHQPRSPQPRFTSRNTAGAAHVCISSAYQ